MTPFVNNNDGKINTWEKYHMPHHPCNQHQLENNPFMDSSRATVQDSKLLVPVVCYTEVVILFLGRVKPTSFFLKNQADFGYRGSG